VKKTAEQIADALIQKIAMPRWEQMARETPGLLEGAHPNLEHMKNIIMSKDIAQGMQQANPHIPPAQVANRTLHNTRLDPEFEGTSQLYRDSKKGLGQEGSMERGRAQFVPTSQDMARQNEMAQRSFNLLNKHAPHPDMSRIDVARKVKEQGSPITSWEENPTQNYYEQSLLAHIRGLTGR